MGFLAVMKAIGYKALYPLVLLGSSLVSFLGFLIAPLVHVVVFIFQLCLLPVRVVPSLESVYIFIGVATVVGILAGLVLHYSLRVAYQLLNLDPADDKHFRPERLRVARKISDRRWPLNSGNEIDNPYFGDYKLGT